MIRLISTGKTHRQNTTFPKQFSIGNICEPIEFILRISRYRFRYYYYYYWREIANRNLFSIQRLKIRKDIEKPYQILFYSIQIVTEKYTHTHT